MLRDLPLDGGTDPVRHEFKIQAGLYKNGFGSRLTIKWKAPRLIGDADLVVTGVPQDLHISTLATVDLNFFANLDQILRGREFIGMRVSCAIGNLLNVRRTVSAGTGTAPLLFTPTYLDPLGRVISVSLRKAW